MPGSMMAARAGCGKRWPESEGTVAEESHQVNSDAALTDLCPSARVPCRAGVSHSQDPSGMLLAADYRQFE